MATGRVSGLLDLIFFTWPVADINITNESGETEIRRVFVLFYPGIFCGEIKSTGCGSYRSRVSFMRVPRETLKNVDAMEREPTSPRSLSRQM